MKNLVVLFLLFSTFSMVGQENVTNAKPKWIIGFGANFIDNTATKDGQYFNASKQWNYIPTVSKVSVERLLTDQFSIEGVVAINTLSSSVMQNGNFISEDVNYLGFDLNGKFYFGKALFDVPAFDPYLVAGFGLNKVDDTSNQSSNFGLGFNYWFKPNFGLRLQTMGKYGFTQNTLLNNHIQHSAELVLKF
jgi:OOP family OmpA-OmpF porin